MALIQLQNNNSIIDRLSAIDTKIAESLFDLRPDPDYFALLKKALSSKSANATITDEKSNMWGLLPGLCCQAAGGQASWADSLAASWILFYAAADLMDSIQDQDEPADWWKKGGPEIALSAATGLFFSAASILSTFDPCQEISGLPLDFYKEFYRDFLQMSSGQYADLRSDQLSLDQYWEITSKKSGSFFRLACRSGASLATQDLVCRNHFADFGHSLGIMIQVLDDLDDLNCLLSPERYRGYRSIFRSVPYIYAFQVLPDEEANLLQQMVLELHSNPQAGEDAFTLIEKSGATVYLLTQIERHRSLAFEKIEKAVSNAEAREMLAQFVRPIGSLKK